jgi:hypothetical protein
VLLHSGQFDVFPDPNQFGEPSNTVNHGVLEVLTAFQSAGDSPPAVYPDPGATIGDPAAARIDVANNSTAGFNRNTDHNDGPAAYNPMWSSADHAYESMQPQICAAQQRTSDHSGVNTSLMQQQYMLPQQQALQFSRNCNTNTYLKPDQWNDVSLPLLHWIKMEKSRAAQHQKASVLRKLNVAYGIGKLLQSSKPAQELCRVENFIIIESSHPCNNTYIGNTGWEVVGIRMINPAVAVQLVSTPGGNFSTFSSASTRSEDVVGRDVSAFIVNNHSPFHERQADFESESITDPFGGV